MGSFGSYTTRTYNIGLNNNYLYNNIGSFGSYTCMQSRTLGDFGYYGGYTNYNRYGNCFSNFGGFGGMLLTTALTNRTNWGRTLYADLDAPSGVASINPFVDYSINRPYMGGGFTGFSTISALTGGLVGPMGFNPYMLYA